MNSKSEKDKRRAFLKRGEIFFKLDKLKDACNDWKKARNLGALEAQYKTINFCKTLESR